MYNANVLHDDGRNDKGDVFLMMVMPTRPVMMSRVCTTTMIWSRCCMMWRGIVVTMSSENSWFYIFS
jgi:hypothetical protein